MPRWLRGGLHQRIGALMVTLNVASSVAQISQDMLDPRNILGVSAFSILFGEMCNLSGHPAAVLQGFKKRDWYWLAAGSSAILFRGIGVGWTLLHFGAISPLAYWPIITAALSWWFFGFFKGRQFVKAHPVQEQLVVTPTKVGVHLN